MLTRRQLLVVGVGVPVLASRASAHDEPSEVESKMVAEAKTPADHAALSAHFRERAIKARANQAHHRLMAQAYTGKQGVGGGRIHCRRLAREYGQVAEEYEALAKLHDEAAKGAP